MILGGMNEGSWPAQPSPDPWLAPRIRRELGLPGLDYRTGLAAHDFMSALGAPRVLLTRARRDGGRQRSPRGLWLRLQAMTGGLARDSRLERLAATMDAPGSLKPADRPAPRPPVDARPEKIAVTDLDRLNADPFAFYAKAILGFARENQSMPSITPRGRAPRSMPCWRHGSSRMVATRRSSSAGRGRWSATRRSTRCFALCGSRG